MQTKVCNALLLILYLCVVESCFVFIPCFICFICVLTKTAFFFFFTDLYTNSLVLAGTSCLRGLHYIKGWDDFENIDYVD